MWPMPYSPHLLQNWREEMRLRYEVVITVHALLTIIFILQLIIITKNLRKLPNSTALIPFIITAVALLLLIIIQVLAFVKMGGINGLFCALPRTIDFLYAMEIGLRPAAFLILIHQRTKLLQNRPKSLMTSHSWKKIFDSALVSIACLVHITYAALATDLCFNAMMSMEIRKIQISVIVGLNHTINIMVLLLGLNVFASLWGLHASSRNAKCPDPVYYLSYVHSNLLRPVLTVSSR